MAEQIVAQGGVDVRTLVDAAKKQLDADNARLGRTFRALSPSSESVSLDVFAAIATARRHALASLAKLLALETQDPAKGAALTFLSTIAAALGSQYRLLQARDPIAARREDRLARDQLVAASRAFAELDRALGCPYGCRKGA